MSKAVIIIPARYGSPRLPDKPLLDIVGRPIIQRVYGRVLQVADVTEAWVVIDDQRVEKAVQAFGGKTIMTRNDYKSGTGRLVGVMHKVEADTYTSLQGGGPTIRPRDVETLLQGVHGDPVLPVATLCRAISTEEATEPSTMKVVISTHQDTLYFDRSPIPYPHDAGRTYYLKHVGIYVYRCDVLQSYSQLPGSTQGQTESLERLWLMSAGISIRTFEVAAIGPGADTPACLEKVRALMAQELAENA